MPRETPIDMVGLIARPISLDNLAALINDKMGVLADGYPEREVQTWAVQLSEAQRYAPGVDTPFLSAAVGPGETVEQYAQLILDNNAAWSMYAGTIVNMRRTYQIRIEVATTVEALDDLNDEMRALR